MNYRANVSVSDKAQFPSSTQILRARSKGCFAAMKISIYIRVWCSNALIVCLHTVVFTVVASLGALVESASFECIAKSIKL